MSPLDMPSFPPMFVVALFAVVASFFFLLGFIIFFHFRRYSIPGDRTALIQKVFVAGNIFFFLLSLAALVSVHWGELFP